MDKRYKGNELVAVLEALIFASAEPLTLNELVKTVTAEFQNTISEHTFLASDCLAEEEAVIAIEEPKKAAAADQDEAAIRKMVIEALDKLKSGYNSPKRQIGRGFILEEVAGGYAFRTNPAYSGFIRRQLQVKPQRLSKAAMECLAIIAYQQPVTKAQIDVIRGVDSGGVVRALLERSLVRVVGRREEPGRPLLYGTTAGFLSLFNLKGLSELPSLQELEELWEDKEAAAPSLNEEPISANVTHISRSFEEEAGLLDKVDAALLKLKDKTEETIDLLAAENNFSPAEKK